MGGVLPPLLFMKIRAFTLIELLMVLVIISVLVSIGLFSYAKNQRKAKLSSYAEPVVRACAMDIFVWCLQTKEQTSPVSFVIDTVGSEPAPLKNCLVFDTSNNLQPSNAKMSTPGGAVSFKVLSTAPDNSAHIENGNPRGSQFVCNGGQVAQDYYVAGKLDGIGDFMVVCRITNNTHSEGAGIKCVIR